MYDSPMPVFLRDILLPILVSTFVWISFFNDLFFEFIFNIFNSGNLSMFIIVNM